MKAVFYGSVRIAAGRRWSLFYLASRFIAVLAFLTAASFMSRLSISWPLLVPVLLLSACAGAQLDPFGRPYSGDDTITPGSVLCADPNVDVQPRMVRGNLPAMPVENYFVIRNAQSKVKYRVSATGVVDVVAVDSGADKVFRNFTIVAVRDWKMTPATRAGVPVAAECETRLGVRYRGYEDEPAGKANQ